ncbi:MAG: hypothetical protein U1F41_07960 [Burkholderiales bacterium]
MLPRHRGARAWLLARRQLGADVAVRTVAVLATTALFFVAAGAVMTDAQLTLGTMLSMVAFYMAVRGDPAHRLVWGYTRSSSVSRSGFSRRDRSASCSPPVPTGLWTIWRRAYGDVWRRIPWITGTLLCAALACRGTCSRSSTPGFIEYFIVGEHWKRCTVAGWEGNCSARRTQPRGLIWPLAVLSTLPWCAVWVFLAWSRRIARTRRAVRPTAATCAPTSCSGC